MDHNSKRFDTEDYYADSVLRNAEIENKETYRLGEVNINTIPGQLTLQIPRKEARKPIPA